jgi:predicted nucleotidyltransferase
MSNLKSILSSFKLQDKLNPKFWNSKENKTETINPKVRERLLEIAYEFIDFLGVDIIVSDVVMTGSLANFNWSKYSDVDLHIIVDFKQFSEKELPLYEELFRLKKTLYNDKHNITIYGYDVELYVQDDVEKHFSSGEYSVLFDEWVSEPKKENVEIDTQSVKIKSEEWMKTIDDVIENAKDESLDDAKKLIDRYKDKLKKYRTSGLEKGGELSNENLVFKVLRRNGYLEKLFNFQNEYIDKSLSLNEIQ